MTKKTKKIKKTPARKKTSVDLETARPAKDSIIFGNPILSFQVDEIHPTLEEQVASLTRRIGVLESFNVRLQELEDASGGIWRMVNGTLIAVRDMSDNHLANAIKLLKQRNSGSPMILKMRAEQQRREQDLAWAKKDGKLSSNDVMDLTMKQVDKLTMAKVEVEEREAPPAGFKIMPIVNGRETGFRCFNKDGHIIRSGTYEECLAAAEAPPAGFKIDYCGGRFQLWEKERYVTNGTYADCLTLAKVRAQAAEPSVAAFAFNGFRLSTNPIGRWYARKGEVLLAAASYEAVIELVKKVTS